MKTLLILSVLLLLISQVSASSAVINIYLDRAGNALFIGTSENPDISLPLGITIEDGEVRGVTSSLTNKEGEEWEFSFALEDSEFFIFLPEGTTLTSVSPGAEIYLSGNQLVVYANNEVDVRYLTNSASESSSVILLAILAAVLIFGIILFLYFKKNKKKENNGKGKDKLIEQMLNEREKIIMEKLKETGKVKSSYLRKLCDIPKASFSRHIHELEKKNLIKRTGEGKNKFIELIK